MSRHATHARSLALVLVVVLAGCLGGVAPDTLAQDGERPAAGSGSEPAATAATASSDAADSDEESAGTAPPTESPWGTAPVVVAIAGSPDRDVAPLVRRAAAFWEANATQYAGYPIDYEVRPNAAEPDLVVRFVDEVTGCKRSDHTAGCAPYITSAAQVDRPVTVEVKRGLSDESTVQVVSHELGHTLGLGHDDEPQAVMRTGVTLTTLPQPNATERGFPWADSDFTVYVDVDEAPDPAAARTQVRAALDYYERGAPGMPDNLTFSVVDDPDADLVVRYASASPCTAGSGSCGSSRGPDPDGDGASERYAQFTVTVVAIDTDAVGWHTGYWLAIAFGAEADADKPPVFRNASYQERRSEWWA
ncbi:matrixin family metalloprotease [Salinigranum halophilum]|uniref:matrixin family metalloprotease n=1 Tax=Salinigranum halophilum TaxID=2565931 RepID=UPI0010A7B234|nr:matrixin family metalloprotease [Salinigranum halophilum]